MASRASAPREYVILRSIVIPSLSKSEQPLAGLVPGSRRERESGERGCGEEQVFQT